jgi:protein-S-isoprenylcysteine O-methyltransferase Ste14
MYLGLLLLYIGIAFYQGNFWTLLLVPPLINLISIFVIGKEEKYLERAFGKNYLDYKRKVRRWL